MSDKNKNTSIELSTDAPTLIQFTLYLWLELSSSESRGTEMNDGGNATIQSILDPPSPSPIKSRLLNNYKKLDTCSNTKKDASNFIVK